MSEERFRPHRFAAVPIGGTHLIGRTLGHYRVTAAVGAGGMGEVYRATDTKLGRDVALKVLPTAFALDSARLARFEREARVLASVNHPGIAHLYGSESAPLPDGTRVHFLVMELVEGEDLAERLERGRVPVDEAIAIARQVAEALEEAHERGIVHRDLKPGNVKITPDGRVKVLDFGLAKALSGDGPGATSAAELSRSPTVAHTGTTAGTILGTAAYMSPEQARGKAVDKRADIWAFGVVLFEMLCGRRLFEGETVTDVLASVVKEPIRWEALPGSTPSHVRRLLARCLERDPRQRLRDVGEARVALGEKTAAEPPGPGSPHPGRPSRATTALGLALLLTAAGLAWILLARPAARHVRLRELSIVPPPKSSFGTFALSPDGRRLAFAAATEGRVSLWLRNLDAMEAVAVPGTEGAHQPFWSPDARSIGFFAGGKLERLDLPGGVVSTICDIGVATGGTWNRDNVILFSRLGGSGISQVAASGGAPRVALPVDPQRQETDYANPFFLPDGRHYLYTVFTGRREYRGVYVGSLDGNGRRKVLDGNTNAIYAAGPRGEGYLLFGRGDALVAQAFDAGRLELRGEPVPIAPRVAMGQDVTGMGRRFVSAAADGVLVFDPSPDRQGSRLAWVDRAGRPAGEPIAMKRVSMVRLSPDGRRFAVSVVDPDLGTGDLWLSDADGANPTRFTFDPANDAMPVWSPDGTRIAWTSNRGGSYDLYEKAASGSGEDVRLLHSDHYKFPTDWSTDGRTILYREINASNDFDLWALPVGREGSLGKPFPFVRTEANETTASFSPDGSRVAYASDESGRFEIYVCAFPSGEGKRQVSTGGGMSPLWRNDGREIYFQAPDGTLMAAAVEPGPAFEVRPPVPLFAFRPAAVLNTPFYSPAPDGRRFLISAIVDAQPGAPLTVVLDWTALLQPAPETGPAEGRP
jgi:Tol biopolymer transport system component/tRNA A-37 threonylcarbamoyl transferase component Bud32